LYLRRCWSISLSRQARLAAAAHTSHPDWVIRLAMSQAASIMDANKAGHYALAVQWLDKAALAHEVLGREDDWSAGVARA
jgi:uncharacterized Zn finger protein